MSNRTFILWNALLLVFAVLLYLVSLLTPREQWPASVFRPEREAAPRDATLDPSSYRAHRHEAGRTDAQDPQVTNESSSRAD